MPLRRRIQRYTDHLPWQRRWVRQGQHMPVDHAGFLAIDAGIGAREPTTLVTLEEVADARCVIALGEPGLGKSRAIDAFVAGLSARVPSDQVLAFDLAEVESRDDFVRRVFQSDAVTRWREGDGALHCVLDSMDEAPIPLQTLCGTLLEELERLPCSRLRLLIVCRTAVLPPGLVNSLRTVFTPRAESALGSRRSVARAAEAEDDAGRDAGVHVGGVTAASVPTVRGNAVAGDEGGAAAGAPAETCLVIEIALLSRDDVRVAAEHALGSAKASQAFLDAVIAVDVGAFAARPITLRALLRRYSGSRALAASQVELYRDLCRELCDPVAPRVGARPHAPRTSREERYWIAGRVCAALLLGARARVWRGDGPAPSARELDPATCVGSEWVHGAVVPVYEAGIAEALNTALFTGEADDTVLAAHQTFAEFVAADWLVHRGMEVPQLLALLHDPTDPERRVVPQLRQTAAWLSALHSSVFDALVRREPELVLWSDIVEIPPGRRADLVAALLERTEANRVVYPGFGARVGYARLAHPGLGAQLEPVVTDRSKPSRARERALEIAAACRVSSLAPVAAELAVDVAEPLDLRVEAGLVVDASEDDAVRCVLMPLLTAPLPEDEADDLRGAVLAACWPLLTPEELFAALRHPRRPNASSAYSRALQTIAEGLTAEYAAAAARWLAQHPVVSSFSPLDAVVRATLLLALAHVERRDVLAPLLTYVRRRLQRHLPFDEGPSRRGATPARDVLIEHPEVRRLITRSLLDGVPGWREPGVHADAAGADGALVTDPALGEHSTPGTEPDEDSEPSDVDPGANVRWIVHSMPELLPTTDIPWALDTLAALPADDPRRPVWRDASRPGFRPEVAEHLESAFRHRGDRDVGIAASGCTARYASVQDALQGFERERASYRAEEELREAARVAEQERDKERRRPAPLSERVTDALRWRPESGSPEAANPPSPWTCVFFELVRNPENTRALHAEPTRATLEAIRAALSRERLAEVLDTALAFLGSERGEDDPFPRGGSLPWQTLKGCVAATLVARIAPDRLTELTPEAWRRWLPTLVRYEPLGGSPDNGPITAVLGGAERTAPDLVYDALFNAVDEGMREPGRRVTHPALALAVHLDPVAETLARRLAGGVYPADTTEWVLRELLWAGDVAKTAARQSAATLVAAFDGTAPSASVGGPTARPADAEPPTAREAAVAAAAALVAADDDAGWDVVGGRLEAEREFSRDVLLFGARHDSLLAQGALDRLSEDRLASLYVIAQREFPPETDPWHVGVFSPGPRDDVTRWRSGLLNALEARRTDAAVDALERIAAASPERDWLVQTWLRASAARFSSRWAGTPPERLMRLAERPDARLVQSGEQLLDVLEESLGRLDRELQGELRSAVGLWDQQRQGREHRGWLPKDEGHLANEIARHLRRDLGARGILVGRELVVQVGIAGGAPGLRTDVDVRAQLTGQRHAAEEVRAIIEIKGSWHREVLTAMRTQLLDDYLVPHNVRHGLYVVGHYTCESWSATAEKRRSGALGTKAKLACELARQAVGLSSAFRTVRAIVLDASLPEAPAAPRGETRARRGQKRRAD